MNRNELIRRIQEERRLDERQLQAVLSDTNTVVSAGAGAGKTTVLSLRFLRLVLEGKAEVDSILTLTFTRKAAAEMKQRIHSLLLTYAQEPIIAHQLDRLEAATVTTLDSFCSQIVKSGARRYGYTPEFRQDEEALGQLAMSTAQRFLYQKLEDPVMQRLTATLSVENVIQGILIPLATNHLSPSRPLDMVRGYEVLEEALKGAVREYENKLHSIASLVMAVEMDSVTYRKAEKAMKYLLEEVLGNEPEVAYSAAREVPGFSLPGRVTREELVILKQELLSYREHFPKYLLLLYMSSNSEYIRSCYELFGQFQEIYLEAKRASGLLSFADVAAMAVDILTEDLEARRFYSRKYSHIMIDEFQDNNDLQRQLLFLLADAREDQEPSVPTIDQIDAHKLFFVGDEKQSIYRFRGADVSVFKALSDSISSSGGAALSLSTNYRSEPTLIRCFNDLFLRIMASPSHDFEARFEPLEYRSATAEVHPQVSLLIRNKQKEDSSSEDDQLLDDPLLSEEEELIHDDDAEAWYLAQTLQEMVEGKTRMVASRGESRPIEYKDIAVLMQSLSNQMRYERAFRALGIPFTALSVRALFLEAPINDIYQVMQLTLYREDRHAAAALFRSPLANLPDDAVILLLEAMRERDCGIFDPGLEELFEPEGGLSGCRQRYQAVKELFLGACRVAGESSLYELVEYIWVNSGYRYLLLQRPENHRYLEYYDYLYEMAYDAHSKGYRLCEFLDEIRQKLGSNERVNDLEVMKLSSEGITLMTIHKSKGLEFPLLCLANAGNRGVSDREPLIFPLERFPVPVITCLEKIPLDKNRRAADYFFEQARERRKEEHLAELKRLLYVACTRAESHLIISGSLHIKKDSSEEIPFSHLLDLVLHGLGLDRSDPLAAEDSLSIRTPSGVTVEVRAIPSYTEGQIRRLRGRGMARLELAQMRQHYESPRLWEPQTTRRVEAVTEYIRGHLTAGTRLLRQFDPIPSDRFLTDELTPVFGTFVHLLIERGIEGRRGEWVELPLEARGLSDRQRDILLEDAKFLSDRFLNEIEPLLTREGVRIESEVPFMFTHEGRLLRAKVDLLIETSDTVYIIDFKTDSNLYEHAHDMQLDLYCEALRQYTGKTSHGMIWYLRDKEQRLWQELS